MGAGKGIPCEPMAKKLRVIDPSDTGKLTKEGALEATEKNLKRMYELLYLMFAENRRSLLIVLHGIDASGKDGTVRNIFSGSNPQGIKVYSFKQPSAEELAHDFLWRCHRLTPERGTTAIFNRSYYEDVTTVKVHPELLAARNIPPSMGKAALFEQRYKQINEFEKMLVENDTIIMKFFLHISKAEQKERLQDRLKDSTKNWKFSFGDLKTRKFWKKYEEVFQEMINHTDSSLAPWRVIPADKKWYRNYLVSQAIVDELEAKKMKFPKLKGRHPKIV